LASRNWFQKMTEIPSFLLINNPVTLHEVKKNDKKFRFSFIEQTLNSSGKFISTTVFQYHSALFKGILQQLNPVVKLLMLLVGTTGIALIHSVLFQLILSFLIFLLVAFSKLRLRSFYKRVLTLVLIFGIIPTLPIYFNWITPGKPALELIKSGCSFNFWIYHVPNSLYISYEGIHHALRLEIKVLNSLALSLLIIHTTQFVDIVKAASRLKAPAIFLLIITLSHKLIFIFTKVLEDSFLGLKSRWWRKIDENASRQIVGNRFLLVFNKTWHRYDQTYKAMIARGFNGTIEHGYQKQLNRLDILFLLLFIVVLSTAVTISNVFQLY